VFGLLNNPPGCSPILLMGGDSYVRPKTEPVNGLRGTNLWLLSCLFSFQTFPLSARTGPVSSILSRLGFQSYSRNLSHSSRLIWRNSKQSFGGPVFMRSP
jgi:hypothetical protein